MRLAVAEAFSSPFWPMVLFAGRSAQEGMDLHQYCLRLMHLTLPRGAVSFEQRQGRIDRFHSLLVRRRAAEWAAGMDAGNSAAYLLTRIFAKLVQDRNSYNFKKNEIYPHWSIPNPDTIWHFQRMMPFWEFTEESYYVNILTHMLSSYRASFGAHPEKIFEENIDLSAEASLEEHS